MCQTMCEIRKLQMIVGFAFWVFGVGFKICIQAVYTFRCVSQLEYLGCLQYTRPILFSMARRLPRRKLAHTRYVDRLGQKFQVPAGSSSSSSAGPVYLCGYGLLPISFVYSHKLSCTGEIIFIIKAEIHKKQFSTTCI